MLSFLSCSIHLNNISGKILSLDEVKKPLTGVVWCLFLDWLWSACVTNNVAYGCSCKIPKNDRSKGLGVVCSRVSDKGDNGKKQKCGDPIYLNFGGFIFANVVEDESDDSERAEKET